MPRPENDGFSNQFSERYMKFPSPILSAARFAFISGALAALFSTASISAEMDLHQLENRVRATRAMSVFQKVELQKEVNELLARFRQAHSGQSTEISTLRPSYERLIASIQSRLGRDPQLAGEIYASREAIWGVLTDRSKFASI